MATFLLVHGGFQGGWIWKRVATVLRSQGHSVYTPTLDGCAERRHQARAGITVQTHVQELVELMFYEDLQNVVVAGTSIGGVIATSTANLARESIERIVLLDALVLIPGENVQDLIKPGGKREWEVTEFTRGLPRHYLESHMLADLDPETRAFALERMTMHPIGAMPQIGEDSDFWDKSWSVTVINSRNSLNPAESHQRRNAEKLNAKWLEIDAGHYPMLSHPEELARMLLS